MKKLIYILIFIIIGCHPEIRTIEKIKLDTIKIASPIIEDTLKAKIITDTIIVADKLNKKDTTIIVKYFPVEKKFYIKAKPDTIKIIDIDTLQTTQIIEKENKTNKILIILLVAGIIILIIKLRR
ncbi:MAG: hypothetical protein QXD05_01425 [Candidatus Pacearchaeota archaeon]